MLKLILPLLLVSCAHSEYDRKMAEYNKRHEESMARLDSNNEKSNRLHAEFQLKLSELKATCTEYHRRADVEEVECWKRYNQHSDSYYEWRRKSLENQGLVNAIQNN